MGLFIFTFYNRNSFCTSSPAGGTLPGKKSRERLRRSRDSGSSGNDRDRSSGSRKSDSRNKSGMVRKPSRELLKIQNFSDSSNEDLNNLSKPPPPGRSKRRGSKLSGSRSGPDEVTNSTDELQLLSLPPNTLLLSSAVTERREPSPKLGTLTGRRTPKNSNGTGGRSRTSSRPSTSSSGGASRLKSSESPEKTASSSAATRKLSEQSPPATSAAETVSVAHQQQQHLQRKSLNRQIKEFIRSPPKTRKLGGSCANFDAFNHTSSLKLSHAMHHNSSSSATTMHKEPTAPAMILLEAKRGGLEDDDDEIGGGGGDQSSSVNQYQFEEYYDYIHPRRSSKEVLDFTSSRKSQKDLTKLEEDRDVGSSSLLGSRYSGEEGGGGQADRERRKDSDHRCGVSVVSLFN